MIYISSDVIIGNFVIEYFKHHQSTKQKAITIPMKNLIKFDEIVLSIVEKDNMYTNFVGFESLSKFEDNYGFFGITLSNDNSNIIINRKIDITRLNRYFRIGIYKSLVKIFEDSYKMVYS